MRTFTSPEQVKSAVGEVLEPGPWLEIDQQRVNTFADATNDHQWIHVDPVRAASGPFGAPIAHGYLTLSLVPGLGEKVLAFDTPGPKINYGLNKVRFPSPVPVGSRLRLKSEILSAEDTPNGVLVTVKNVVEIEGSERPACVVESLILLLNA